MLDHIITKAVCKDLAGQRWDRNSRRLALQDVAEVLEVRIASAHAAVAEFEGGDVGAANDLVVCVHVAAHAMSAGVLDLGRESGGVGGRRRGTQKKAREQERRTSSSDQEDRLTSISRKFSGGP